MDCMMLYYYIFIPQMAAHYDLAATMSETNV